MAPARTTTSVLKGVNEEHAVHVEPAVPESRGVETTYMFIDTGNYKAVSPRLERVCHECAYQMNRGLKAFVLH